MSVALKADEPSVRQSAAVGRAGRTRGASRPRRTGRRLALPVMTPVALLLAVQLAIFAGLLPRTSVPYPSEMFVALAGQVGEASFWAAVGNTLQGWGIGLLLATVIAIPLGTLAGLSTPVYRSLRVVVDFLRPIPPVAVLPLLILVLGLSLQTKFVIVSVTAFFPLYFATMYGVHSVDPVARDTAISYRLGRLRRFVFISLPGALPYTATGMRIAASVGLLIAVGTEMIIGVPGLGREIFDAQAAGRIPEMYALVFASGLLGLLIAALFGVVERRVLRWHPSQAKELSL